MVTIKLGDREYNVDFSLILGGKSSQEETFHPVGKLAMPSKELCVSVGMNDVGYLTPDMAEKYILTFALGPCIGLYTRNIETGSQTLAHISSNSAGKARAFMQFVRGKKLIQAQGPKVEGLIQILQSPHASDGDVSEVRKALNGFGATKIEVLKKLGKRYNNELDSINVIYDSEGRMYELTDIRDDIDLDDSLKNAMMLTRAFSPNLHVTNEDWREIEDPLERYKKERHKYQDFPRKIDFHKSFFEIESYLKQR